MRRKLLSVILSLLIAVTFMPQMGLVAYAAPVELGQVTGLTVSANGYSYATIGWDAVDGAKGYKVYRATSETGKFKLAKTTTALKFKDTKNNKPGLYKYYKVKAYMKSGKKTYYGPCSEVFQAKAEMKAPETIKTSQGSGSITVSWSKVAGATGYRVYRADEADGEFEKITSTKSLACKNSVSECQRYYYKVRATRNGGYGLYSDVVQGMAKLPAPAELTVACENGEIKMNWPEVSQADGYEIYRSTRAVDGFQKVGETAETAFADKDESLVESTDYCYKVRAYALVNGNPQYGYYTTTGSRDKMVSQAVSWHGLKESNKSNKVIITTFNNKKGTNFNYRTPWCAIFVSACAIKSGNASLVPLSASCPDMKNRFSSKTTKTADPANLKKLQAGDVIFYDWNNNNVPDHVGLIASTDCFKSDSGTGTIQAIEGNTRCDGSKSDCVAYRSWKTTNKFHKDVYCFGFPKYPKATSSVTYQKPEIANPVSEEAVSEALEEITGQEEAVVSEEQEAEMEPAAEPESESDFDMAVELMEYIQEENPADSSSAEESTYDAFLVMEVCEDMGISACVLTTVDASGNETSWNEVELDGKTYIVNAAEESEPVAFTPEEIN